MQINLPLLLLAIPLLFAGLTFLFARWTAVQAVLGGFTCLVIAFLVKQVPLESVVLFAGQELRLITQWSVFGRSFIFGAEDRSTLVFLYLAAGLLICVAATANTPASFVPTSLAILPLLSAVVLVEPFLFAAIFLEIAVGLAVFMLANGEYTKTRGPLRMLVFFTVGMPFILLAGWQMDALAISPGNSNALSIATTLLTIGSIILLSVAPFHAWIPEVAQNSAPLPVAFVLSVLPSAIVFFLLNALNEQDWLRNSQFFYATMRWGGIGLIAVGGLFALGQKDFGRLMGYAVLIDYGAVCLAISLLSNGTSLPVVETVLSILLVRVLSLALWAIGMGVLREFGSTDSANLWSKARQYPLSSIAMLFGTLAVVGFPLTVGFPARWALLRQLAGADLMPAFVLLLGSLCVLVGLARGVYPLLMEPTTELDEDEMEPLTTSIYSLIGILTILLLGVFPQWILQLTTQLATAFQNLISG
jgi:formate hydrogenlyase subunit 3/multisubunit Na+/H+ antiporter MnhD subunit